MMRRRRRYLLERAEQAGGGCGAGGEQSRSRDWLYESYYCMSQQHPLIVFLLLIVMGACLALLAVFFASGLVRDSLSVRDPRCSRASPASPLPPPRWHRRARRSQPSPAQPSPAEPIRTGRCGGSRCCSSCGGKLVSGGAEVAAGPGEPPPELCRPIFGGDAGAAAARLMERKTESTSAASLIHLISWLRSLPTGGLAAVAFVVAGLESPHKTAVGTCI